MSEAHDTRERRPPQRAARRQPGRLRRWVVRPFVWLFLLVIVVAVGGLALLQSGPAREQVRVLLEQELGKMLEREVRIASVRYRLLPLMVEAHGLVVAGPGSEEPAVLSVDRVRIEGELRQRRRPTLELSRLEIERPQIYVHIDEDGTDNLPKLAHELREGEPWLEVRIGELTVRDGTFQLNELTLPLDVVAVGLVGRLSGDDRHVLSGRVSAEELELTLPGARPHRLSLAARIRIAPGHIDLTGLRLASAELRAVLGGTVQTGAEPRVSISGTVDSGTDLAVGLGYLEPGRLQGPVRLETEFEWEAGTWGLEGSFTSPRMVADGHLMTELAGVVSARRGVVHVDLEEARYAGGALAGALSLQTLKAPVWAEVTLNFSGLWLEQVLADRDIPIEGLAGELTGLLNYRFGVDRPEHGSGWGDLQVAAGTVGRGGRRVPVAGSAPFLIEGGVVSSQAVRLRMPEQEVGAEIVYALASREGEIHFELASRDVGVLRPLLPGDDPEDPPLWLPSDGTGTALGRVWLRPERVTAELDLDLRDAVSLGLSADRVHGLLRLAPEGLEEVRLEVSRGDGALLLAGSVPFDGEAAVPFRLTLDAQDWPVADARPWLPFRLPLEGPFSGRLELAGNLEEMEGALRGRVERAVIFGVPSGELAGSLYWDGEGVWIEEASLTAEAGVVSAAGAYELAGGRLSLAVDGERLDLGREPFASWLPGDLAGFADLVATIEGTLEEPSLEAAVVAESLVLAGRELGPEGRAELSLAWDGRELVAAGSLLGLVEIDGGGRLDREEASLVFRLASEELDGLARAVVAQPLPDFEGRLAGLVRVDGQVASPETLRVGVELEVLELRYQELELAQLEPVTLRLEEGRLAIDSLYLGDVASDSELFVAGAVGLGDGFPLDLRMQASLATTWLELFVPGVRVFGTFDALATVRGTVAEPEVRGQGEVRRGRLILAQLPHSFDDLHAVVLFSPREVVLDSARANVAGGEVVAGGSIRPPTATEPLRYQLQMVARRLNLRYPEGWLVRGDADLTFLSVDDGHQVRGRVDVERALYLQDFDVGIAQLGRRLLQRQRPEVIDAEGPLAATQLNILLSAPAALRVRNNVANLHGSAELTVRGTVGRPIVFGRVEVDRGGRLVFADTEYRVERASLTFANPLRIDPVVDVVAQTEVRNFAITLNLDGTLDRLQASFASDPPLSEIEVLALLTTGELAPAGRRTDIAETNGVPALDAESILLRQAAAAIGQRANTLFGLDKFRVDPLTSTGETGSFARLTLGKRLGRDLFATYSFDPAQTEAQTLQLEWQVTDRLVLIFTQNGDGSYTTDARWEHRF